MQRITSAEAGIVYILDLKSFTWGRGYESSIIFSDFKRELILPSGDYGNYLKGIEYFSDKLLPPKGIEPQSSFFKSNALPLIYGEVAKPGKKLSCKEVEKRRRDSLVKNPHLDDLKEDVLYHLGLTTQKDDLKIFQDVKYVCVGGTPERMKALAEYVNQILERNCSLETETSNISKSSRYSLFKAGPVLCVSHGIGSPSISIVMHEIMKLMHHAGVQDPIFLRLGTSGGLGVPPGSIVITSESVNGLLLPYQELVVLGKKIQRSSILDQDLNKEIKAAADKYLKNCSVFIGKTMCADDFYESQGRLDGAFCDYTSEDKICYLRKLKNSGILNIEMESVTFAAMCRKVGVKGAVICVTMLDRLKGDQVTAPNDIMKEWQERVLHLASMYIKEKLNGNV